MHLKRWITALILLPLLVLLIYKGGAILFSILISIICLLALHEYFHIQFYSQPVKMYGFMVGLAFTTGLMMIWSAYFRSSVMMLTVMTVNFIVLSWAALVAYKTDPSVLQDAAKQGLGIFYIPLLLSYLVLIRMERNGAVWIFFLLFLIILQDTAAFYGGSYFGKRKLYPSVSPGKTVEGALAGMGGTVLAGLVFKLYVLPEPSWIQSACLWLVVGAVGPVGDLFESALKRTAGVKDSGAVLPGHGGILDRIDGLLFAGPVVYLFMAYMR